MAEDRGFEPLKALALTDFKSAAFDHSASPPSMPYPSMYYTHWLGYRQALRYN